MLRRWGVEERGRTPPISHLPIPLLFSGAAAGVAFCITQFFA